MSEHIDASGRFQSDKYDWCKPDFVPLKVTDSMAQPVLWAYAQARRSVDAAFADDLERRLLAVGYEPAEPEAQCIVRTRADGSYVGSGAAHVTMADLRLCQELLQSASLPPDDAGVYTWLVFASEADRKAYEQAMRARGESLPKGTVLVP
jgi:hypothetical protein